MGITDGGLAGPKMTTSIRGAGGGTIKASVPAGDRAFGVGPSSYSGASPWLLSEGKNVFTVPQVRSSNSEVVPARRQAVANARKIDRDHNLIAAGITKRAAATVGANLRLQYLPNWSALGIDGASPQAIKFVQQVENHFSLWGEDFRLLCDASRKSTFGAMMLTSAREALGPDGETFIYSRYSEERMEEYRGRYASFIELISCDRLSTPSGRPALSDERRRNGTALIAGKELDRWGAATGYWIEDGQVGDHRGGEPRTWNLIPRETDTGRPVGIHWFPQIRAGAQRGMPSIIQSLRNVKMLDKFDDAELQTAVLNAILSIFVESESTSAEMLQKLQAAAPSGGKDAIETLWDLRFGYYEENQLNANGARVPVLPPGDKIHMQSTQRAAGDTSTFRNAFNRGFAAQLNLSFEEFTGDYSETTFSSARSAAIDIWRLKTIDRILFTQHVSYQVFVGFLEELWVRADELGVEWPAGSDFYEDMTAWSQCDFRGPSMGWIDPLKDADAAARRMELGLTSPTREAAAAGEDFRDNIDQIKRDHDYARSQEVFVPGMPEYVEMNQPIQPVQAAEEEELDDEGNPKPTPEEENDRKVRARMRIKRGNQQ